MLLLFHEFFPFLQAVALALDVNDSAVVENAVEDRGGNGDVGEDLVPLREGLVGGKDGGGLLVPLGDQLKEQVRALDVHGQVANLVNDEQLVAGELLHLFG